VVVVADVADVLELPDVVHRGKRILERISIPRDSIPYRP